MPLGCQRGERGWQSTEVQGLSCFSSRVLPSGELAPAVPVHS